MKVALGLQVYQIFLDEMINLRCAQFKCALSQTYFLYVGHQVIISISSKGLAVEGASYPSTSVCVRVCFTRILRRNVNPSGL